MTWPIHFVDAFRMDFASYDKEVQDQLLATLKKLADEGPTLGRPYADTLKGSKHANMKELRFRTATQVWRVAFAFDPRRKAVVLAGDSKSGKGQERFYGTLIMIADRRFDEHLAVAGKRLS